MKHTRRSYKRALHICGSHGNSSTRCQILLDVIRPFVDNRRFKLRKLTATSEKVIYVAYKLSMWAGVRQLSGDCRQAGARNHVWHLANIATTNRFAMLNKVAQSIRQEVTFLNTIQRIWSIRCPRQRLGYESGNSGALYGDQPSAALRLCI